MIHMNPVHIITTHTLRNILNYTSQCQFIERLCEITVRLVYNLLVLYRHQIFELDVLFSVIF